MIPEWQSSANDDSGILCLFEGGYLPHLADTLQLWYDKGVRLFNSTFAYFEAATPMQKQNIPWMKYRKRIKLLLCRCCKISARK